MMPLRIRTWVRRAEVDGGMRPGLTTEERQRLKELEKENKELHCANEILMAAAAIFGTQKCPGETRQPDK